MGDDVEPDVELDAVQLSLMRRMRSHHVFRCVVVWVILVVAPFGGALFAQTTGAPTAPTVDFFSDLWAKIQQAGPFAAMVAMFFLIRSEKRSDRLILERDGLLERVITGLHNATTAVEAQSKMLERALSLIADRFADTSAPSRRGTQRDSADAD